MPETQNPLDDLVAKAKLANLLETLFAQDAQEEPPKRLEPASLPGMNLTDIMALAGQDLENPPDYFKLKVCILREVQQLTYAETVSKYKDAIRQCNQMCSMFRLPEVLTISDADIAALSPEVRVKIQSLKDSLGELQGRLNKTLDLQTSGDANWATLQAACGDPDLEVQVKALIHWMQQQ